MKLSRFLAFAIALGCISINLATTTRAAGLRDGFANMALADAAGAGDGPETNCPELVSPLVDMSSMFGFYQPGSTMSVVDPAKMSAYTRRLAAINELKAELSRQVVTIFESQQHRGLAAACIVRQIEHWAQAGALLGNLDDNTPLGRRQAILEMTWTAIAISNALAIAEQVQPIPASVEARVDDWMRRLISAIRGEFVVRDRQADDEWLNERSNHWLWAGAAVARLAIEVDDRSAFNWSMTVLNSALEAVPVDGGLPLELRRGAKALGYQTFALSAISIMAWLAEVNDVELTSAARQGLQAVTLFSIAGFENPELVEARTGYQQERSADMGRWSGPLALIYRARDPALSAHLQRMFASVAARIGGRCDDICIPYFVAAGDS